VKDARRQGRGRGSGAELPLCSCRSRHAGRSEECGKRCWLTTAIRAVVSQTYGSATGTLIADAAEEG